MKQHEFNSLTAYLTRPGNKSITGGQTLTKVPVRKPSAVPPKTKTIQKFSKGGKPENSKMLDYVDTKIAMHEPERATKEQKKKLEMQLKKVANKPNGKYTPPNPPQDSFDWDLWLRDRPNYQTLEEELKKESGILEQDLANEYWQEQYEIYLKKGGTLDFKQFMEQQLNNKLSKEINKRVKDKMQTEGIAQILGVDNTGRKI